MWIWVACTLSLVVQPVSENVSTTKLRMQNRTERIQSNTTDSDNDRSWTLSEACGVGNLEVVRRILDLGADVIQNNIWGEAALFVPDETGQLHVEHPLRSFEEHLRVGDEDPLTAASRAGHLEVVRLLLDRGALDTLIDEAFLAASTAGHLEVVRLLLDRGADI